MKYTVLKCDCCGKEFYTEYWTGGYIDHCVNFLGNMKVCINRGVNDVFRAICFDGNKRRRVDDVKTRLECFKIYCKKVQIQDKGLVNDVCDCTEKYIDRQNFLDDVHDKICDMVKDFDDFEREYIGLEYQGFDTKRLKGGEV